MVENILYILAAYVIGSVPFGFLAGKMRGIDLREHGSCNIGATNAVRVLGKAWGVPVFFCDFLKGLLPLLYMKNHLGCAVTEMSAADMGWLLGVMFALVLGHTYTCFLGFKGGKGVATTAGCMFAFSPVIGLAILATWIITMVLTRYVSLSSMVAGLVLIATAVWQFWLQDGVVSVADGMALGLLFLIFVLVVYKHRSNIVRLCNGTEPKAFAKKSK
ncbi:MAG: glycerol-3-phosphate 1-O-acyltransferase PlsY [Akkermansia sp.]|nr:glycerol-3-phosphate 1-O-acyltransferase PlsY [Akkermansia sp.]